MTLSDKLALIAMILNIVVMIIAIYQTMLTRNSLGIASETIRNDKKLRELELLPRANFIIHVMMFLEKWLEDIERIQEELELILLDKNSIALKDISNHCLKSPKNLVDKYYYEKSPDWLAEIYMTGAKYYYSVRGPLYSLWDEQKQEGRIYMIDSMVERCKEHVYNLKSLKKYIEDTIPNSYLNALDSIADEKFLSDD